MVCISEESLQTSKYGRQSADAGTVQWDRPARVLPSASASLLNLSKHFVGVFDGLDTVVRATIACVLDTVLQQTDGVL